MINFGALEVGRRKAAALLILLRFGYIIKKICQSTALQSSGDRTADLSRKPAVVPAFIRFRLEFGETEILADLPRHK